MSHKSNHNSDHRDYSYKNNKLPRLSPLLLGAGLLGVALLFPKVRTKATAWCNNAMDKMNDLASKANETFGKKGDDQDGPKTEGQDADKIEHRTSTEATYAG